MTPAKQLSITVWVVLALALAGCAQNMDMETMRTMVSQRPPELSRLEVFAGTWEITGESKTGDQTQRIRGTSEVDWECDGHYLVEHYSADMGEAGSISGMTLWTWDPRGKTYRWWWFGSDGGTSTGTVTYDEGAQTWNLRSAGRNYKTGQTGRATQTIHVRGPDEMEWTWIDWDAWGLVRRAEFHGTSRRQAAAAGP